MQNRSFPRKQRYGWGRERTSGFVLPDALFVGHVLELTGLEDFSALPALHELGFLVAGNDLHARVLARLVRSSGWAGRLRGWPRLRRRHTRNRRLSGAGFLQFRGADPRLSIFAAILERPEGMSSTESVARVWFPSLVSRLGPEVESRDLPTVAGIDARGPVTIQHIRLFSSGILIHSIRYSYYPMYACTFGCIALPSSTPWA